jgi:subfamily B ATP-binding cassette protein HlyB/CyaB
MNVSTGMPSADDAVGYLKSFDTGLAALALVAGYYRIAADADQLSHELALAGRLADADDLARAARLLGLKARVVATKQSQRD